MFPRVIPLILAAVVALSSCSQWQRKEAKPAPDPAAAALKHELEIPHPAAPPEAAKKPAAAMEEGAVPPVSSYLPQLATRAREPRFDLVVTDAPARQVFLSMVNGTRYSVVLHPDVAGNISVDLKDTTVPEALDVLRDLYGYDYQVHGTRITVFGGKFRTRVFSINYLSVIRNGRSDVRVTSGSLSSGGSNGQNGNNNSNGATNMPAGTQTTGSPTTVAQESSRITTNLESDFWKDVQNTLRLLVGVEEGRQVVVSPITGTVVIRATPQELASVAQYLKALGGSVARQVMLEAKIIDVQLSDSQQEGINWSAFRIGGNSRFTGGVGAPGTVLQPNGTLGTGGTAFDANGNLVNPALSAIPGAALAIDPRNAGGLLGLAFQTSNFAALLSFLETQGRVQVLSSPRIATLNNQKAVLKVGTDDFFVTNVSSNAVASGTGTVTTPSVTLQPFFSGIALDVTPQIDDLGNVTLHVHPQVSAVTEKSKVINLGSQGIYTLPLASSNVSETDSIVRISDSHIVAIGGLMQRQDTVANSSVPGVGDVPVVGRLFHQNASATNKRELVILIKPTVLKDAETWDAITQEAARNIDLRMSNNLSEPAGAAK